MLAGPLGVVRMVRAIATRGLGSGKERVQPMHLSLDCSLFTKALEEGSKVYEAAEFSRGTAQLEMGLLTHPCPLGVSACEVRCSSIRHQKGLLGKAFSYLLE